MARVFNFAGGPATLPESVLEEAAGDIVEYSGRGYSILEMGHRTQDYAAVYEETTASLRKLMQIPEDYEILFLHGGATLQFSMVPLNLLPNAGDKADYVITGAWSKKAATEASRFGDVHIAATGEAQKFTEVPRLEKTAFRPDAEYIHVTTNNTIFGTRLVDLPPEEAGLLVGDMSSNILAEPVDVSRFGLIYAGAQKNIGTAGLCVVILRKDLVGRARKDTPVLLNYAVHVEKKSAYNTPPVFAVYLAGKVFDWALNEGGVAGLYQRNLQKAKMVYRFLDHSKLFYPLVNGPERSLTNVTFRLKKPHLEKAFHEGAAIRGLVNLGGHRWVGGMRASMYNAMPVEGVAALVRYMTDFEAENAG